MKRKSATDILFLCNTNILLYYSLCIASVPVLVSRTHNIPIKISHHEFLKALPSHAVDAGKFHGTGTK